jgi:hypothetical protein
MCIGRATMDDVATGRHPLSEAWARAGEVAAAIFALEVPATAGGMERHGARSTAIRDPSWRCSHGPGRWLVGGVVTDQRLTAGVVETRHDGQPVTVDPLMATLLEPAPPCLGRRDAHPVMLPASRSAPRCLDPCATERAADAVLPGRWSGTPGVAGHCSKPGRRGRRRGSGTIADAPPATALEAILRDAEAGLLDPAPNYRYLPHSAWAARPVRRAATGGETRRSSRS